ncbi:hypothetical protein DFH27DRAFT_68326 [Peziza echinospora]|nr:hypothetical protein DFH27DRAFT_68326 [Peziza echinospora]
MQPPKDPSAAPNTLHKRPTTPKSASASAAALLAAAKENHPPVPEIPAPKKDDHHSKDKKEKRSSLAFLRRSKSGDTVRPRAPLVPQEAPRLPELWNANQGGGIGGSPPRPGRESVDIGPSGLNIPGMSPGRKSTDTGSGVSSGYGKSIGKDSALVPEEPLNAAASMAHRGRYSVASAGSTVNSPRRVRRRKDPTPFNILIIGARNSGKTSFIQFLGQSLALKPSKHDPPMESTPEEPVAAPQKKSTFVKTYLETEIDGERIGLTLWDSQGFEKNIVDLQLRETIAFIESKFEESFTEETKVIRAPGVRDTHIHCAFHLIDPARLEASIVRASPTHGSANGNILSGGLDEDLDLQVLMGLKGKTTVVPVISKADTITSAHMNVLKHLVRTSLKSQGLDPLEALEIDLEAYGITPALVPPNMHSSTTHPPKPDANGAAAGAIEAGTSSDSDANDSDSDHPHHTKPTPRRRPSSIETASTILDNEMSNVEFLPLSIISPDSYEPGAIGRVFPWGFADPYNAAHCDFVRLKEAVFSEWRGELRESSREIWYENWRTSRLSGPGGNGAQRKNGLGGRRR